MKLYRSKDLPDQWIGEDEHGALMVWKAARGGWAKRTAFTGSTRHLSAGEPARARGSGLSSRTLPDECSSPACPGSRTKSGQPARSLPKINPDRPKDELHLGLPARPDDDRIDEDQITVEVKRCLGRVLRNATGSSRSGCR